MPKFNFTQGASVGMLYMQGKDKSYTIGVYNGAFDYYDSKRRRYVIRQSGSAVKGPSGNYEFNIQKLYGYENQNYYNRPKPHGNAHGKPPADDYWVIGLLEIQEEKDNYTHHPGIAFVTTDGKVHNGKFAAFTPLGSGTEITHYDEITESVKTGSLTYWHYNAAPSSRGAYNVYQEKRTVDILDMTELV